MKGILLPQDERTVTPGKKAVSDLESLPTPEKKVKVIKFGDVIIHGSNGVLETHREVCLDAQLHVYDSPERTFFHAVQDAEKEGKLLPSAPLFFDLLLKGYVQTHFFLMEELKEPPEHENGIFSWYCNTRIHRIQNTIQHYPWMACNMKDPESGVTDTKYVNARRPYSHSIGFETPKYPPYFRGEKAMEDIVKDQDSLEHTILEDIMGKGNPLAMNIYARMFGMPFRVRFRGDNTLPAAYVTLQKIGGTLLLNLDASHKDPGAYRMVSVK